MNKITTIILASLLFTGCAGVPLPEEGEGITSDVNTCDTPPLVSFIEALMCQDYAYCFDADVDPNNPPPHCRRARENIDYSVCEMYNMQEVIADYEQCDYYQ